MTIVLNRTRRLPLPFRTWLALTGVLAFAAGFSVPLQLEIIAVGATRPLVSAYAAVFAVVALCHVVAQIVGRRYRPASLAPAATGFTLIELIVVILILGILAGIGTLAYSGVIERAHYTVAKAELAQAGRSIVATTTVDGSTPTDVPADVLPLLARFDGYEYAPTGQAFTLQGRTPNLCFAWPGRLTDGLCDATADAPDPHPAGRIVAASGSRDEGLLLGDDGRVFYYHDAAPGVTVVPLAVDGVTAVYDDFILANGQVFGYAHARYLAGDFTVEPVTAQDVRVTAIAGSQNAGLLYVTDAGHVYEHSNGGAHRIAENVGSVVDVVGAPGAGALLVDANGQVWRVANNYAGTGTRLLGADGRPLVALTPGLLLDDAGATWGLDADAGRYRQVSLPEHATAVTGTQTNGLILTGSGALYYWNWLDPSTATPVTLNAQVHPTAIFVGSGGGILLDGDGGVWHLTHAGATASVTPLALP